MEDGGSCLILESELILKDVTNVQPDVKKQKSDFETPRRPRRSKRKARNIDEDVISSLLDDDFDIAIGLSSGYQDGNDLSITGVRPLAKKTKKDGTLTKRTSQDWGTKPKASSGSSSLQSSQEIDQNAAATKPKPKPRPKPTAKPNHNTKTTRKKPKKKTATKKTVTKEILQMVATLKTIVKCVLDFSQAVKHMSKPERRQITESMITSGQLDKTIQKYTRNH